jgi:hypothetical protein
MKFRFFSAVFVAFVFTSVPSLAQTAIGKCMRADCASMQSFCQESKTAGKTGTDCEAAGALCAKNQKWVGTRPDGKKWSCTF